MKISGIAFISILLLFATAACGSSTYSEGIFTVESSDIDDGSTVGQKFAGTDCGGENTSPEISWSNAPSFAQSFAVAAIDTTSANGIQWLMYDIPANITSLEQGAATPTGATLAINSFGQAAYTGPCPPEGSTHTYEFWVWPLDIIDMSQVAGFSPYNNDLILNTILIHAVDGDGFTATYAN